MYIAFDPGPVVGWCKFNNRGHELEMGHINLEDLAVAIEAWPTVAVRQIILEQWEVIPGKIGAQIGRAAKAKIPTIEAIGTIKSWAKRKNVPVELVSPRQLLPAQKWTQVKMPKDHSTSHQISAFLHGARWLIDNDLRPTALEMANARKQEEGTGTRNPGQTNGGAGSIT